MQALDSPWIDTGFQSQFTFVVDLLYCQLDNFEIGIKTENYFCTLVYCTSVRMAFKKKNKVFFSFLKLREQNPQG